MLGLLRIIVMILLGTAVPVVIGGLFLPLKKEGNKLLFCWVSGQMVLWTLFLCVCVPLTLIRSSFSQVELIYLVCTGFLCLIGVAIGLVKHRFAELLFTAGKAGKNKDIGSLLWILFAAMVLVQLFLLCFLAYEEGDDAYYVGVTTASRGEDILYEKDPYMGTYVILDSRHALAPMPVWVSVLADVGGIHGAAMAHCVLPLLLILMTYGIFYLFGEKLLKEREQLPLFMCFLALLVFFGGYSLFSAENFMLVRTAQGKSILANIVFPFLLYLLLLLMENLERGAKNGAGFWLLMGMVMASGCLCSTLGSLLLCVLLGIACVCGVLCYGKWKLLLPMAFCMLVPVAIAGIYMVL